MAQATAILSGPTIEAMRKAGKSRPARYSTCPNSNGPCQEAMDGC
jgi:hypothetical protein